jgi:hypothetical protein
MDIPDGIFSNGPSMSVHTTPTDRYGRASRRIQLAYGLVITVTTRGHYFDPDAVRAQGLVTDEIQKVLKAANLDLAGELRAAVLQALDDGRLPNRRLVSTGRLDWALAHERNMIIRPWGFGVGVRNWLDRSQAKYWRQIDEGTSVHIGGEPFYGIWGASATQNYSGRGKNRWMVPGGPYSSTATRAKGKGDGRKNGSDRPAAKGDPSHSGKFLPMRMATNVHSNVNATLLGANLTGAVTQRMEIRNPIKGEHYFDRAWQKMNMPQKAQQALADAIREVLGARAARLTP